MKDWTKRRGQRRGEGFDDIDGDTAQDYVPLGLYAAELGNDCHMRKSAC